MNKELKLVPLSIPAGWMIIQNHFYMTTFEDADGGFPFYEDILHMENVNLRLTLDLGWYPEGDANGAYKLVLLPWKKQTKPFELSKKTIKKGFKNENFIFHIKENKTVLWQTPICVFKASTWQEIAIKMNEFLKCNYC